jgi:hypothetical protein
VHNWPGATATSSVALATLAAKPTRLLGDNCSWVQCACARKAVLDPGAIRRLPLPRLASGECARPERPGPALLRPRTMDATERPTRCSGTVEELTVVTMPLDERFFQRPAPSNEASVLDIKLLHVETKCQG